MSLGLHDFDEIECLDTLLSRYGNIDYVMNLSFVTGLNLIQKMNIRIAEDRLFQQWNMEHIFMDKDNFVSFEDYKNKAFKNVNNNKLSKKEIHEIAKKNIAEAEKIKASIRKGGYTVETI